ncbi:putative secreted effector protein [Blumeria graminis f. sp. tritici 96224]|nr:putative secreted effector protein [Blumeria graminis f. sp. tritici 96224]
MKLILPHLAIALLGVVTPALAVMYDCSGVLIDGSDVAAQMEIWTRQFKSFTSTLEDGTNKSYKYFKISPRRHFTES